MDEETKRRIIELYAKGDMTVAAISRETGRAPSTIYWILQQNGVTKSRKRAALAEGEEVVTLDWAMRRIAQLERENGTLAYRLGQAEAALDALLRRVAELR